MIGCSVPPSLPTPELLDPKEAHPGVRTLEVGIFTKLWGRRDHLERGSMENGELLTGGESKDIAVSLILGIDPPQSRFEHPTLSSRSIAVDQFQDGDSVSMTAAHFKQKAALGLLERG